MHSTSRPMLDDNQHVDHPRPGLETVLRMQLLPQHQAGHQSRRAHGFRDLCSQGVPASTLEGNYTIPR
jgi:hypothetical protein